MNRVAFKSNWPLFEEAIKAGLTVSCIFLLNFRFIQYYATVGGADGQSTCFLPTSSQHSVVLQYTVDGGKMIVLVLIYTTVQTLGYEISPLS